MAVAQFAMYQYTGATASVENLTSKAPAFVSTSAYTTDHATYYLDHPAPGGSAVYSYEMWLGWKCTTKPDTKCYNFGVFGPTVQPDDPTDKLTILWGKSTSAVTPITTVSTIATNVQHSNYYSSGTAYDLTSIIVPADDQIDAVGEYVRYFVAQLKVEDGVLLITVPIMLFQFEYDEL